ncbi:MAG TPA: peptide-binding protein [Polyangiaceae bacterium]|nr:peptide-binding protein [Polyangiaceae bacterium]
MSVRHILLFLPLLLAAFLLQSSLWVPRYDAQARGNQTRLTTYIEGSIGDAKILNPILSNDSASSDVMDRRIFEGLIDADENLTLKPQLAESFETTEEATIAALPQRTLPDGSPATAQAVLDAVLKALGESRLGELGTTVVAAEIVPKGERSGVESVVRPNKEGKPEPTDVNFKVAVPERVKLKLRKVVPDLFTRLDAVLGADYFKNYPFEREFKFEKPEDLADLREKLPDLLGIGEHHPVITFHLRKGVRFHDGQPFGARDVQFTYEAAIDPKNASPRSSSFEPIERVEVVDEHTVRIVYKRLHSPAIVDWSIGILPAHLLDKPALEREMERRKLSPDARKTFSLRNTDFNLNPVGTGPFRFAEWKREQYVRLTRNDDYWAAKPEYKEIYYRIIPDSVAQELELQAGAVDAYGVLPHQAARFRKDKDFQVLSASQSVYSYIGYNLRHPMFKDVRVRKALGMAINVDELIKYVLYGEAKRTSGPYYQNTPYYNRDVPLLPYDPAGALELLRQAGWTKNKDGFLEKDGKVFEFTLITNNGNPQRAAIMTVAQAAWRRLGIRCETQTFEWTVFLEDFVEAHKFDAFILGWAGGGLDPDLYQIWHSSQTDKYELNKVGYQNKEVDELILRIRQEYDRDKQIELAHRLHAVIAGDQPYTFLYAPKVTWAIDNKIVIVNRKPDGSEDYAPIAVTPSGEISYFFNKWRKLPSAPHFAAEH